MYYIRRVELLSFGENHPILLGAPGVTAGSLAAARVLSFDSHCQNNLIRALRVPHRGVGSSGTVYSLPIRSAVCHLHPRAADQETVAHDFGDRRSRSPICKQISAV
jgi:hypothetical protein